MSESAKALQGEVQAPKKNGNSKPSERGSEGKRKLAVVEPTPPAVAEGDALLLMIERVARDPSVDIDRMQKLMQMHQDAEAKRQRTAFLAALSKLQAALPAIERKGKGQSGKYARFEDFIEAIKPQLAAHGFSLTFRIKQEPNIIHIVGVLGHEAGHQEETELALPADSTGNKNAVQAVGSSVQYGKRYVGMTLLGIASEDEDDDGKAAGAGAKIGAEDVEKLRSLIMETQSDLAFFYNMFEIECLEDMPTAKLATALRMLDLKKNKKR